MSNINEAVSMNFEYFPVGSSERVQKDIARCVSELLATKNGKTLEELGYLGSTVLANPAGSQIMVKLMFHPDLATTTVVNQHTNEAEVKIDDALDNLTNFMFVGSVSSKYVCSIERCVVPKYDIEKMVDTETDKKKKVLSVRRADNGQVTRDHVKMDCLVITCNPYLVFAKLVDTSLLDPNFGIRLSPVKKQAKSVRPDRTSFVPTYVTVTKSIDSANFHYDPSEAVPYLKGLAKRTKNVEKTKRDLGRRAHEEADENPKKVKSAKNNVGKKDKDLRMFKNL